MSEVVATFCTTDGCLHQMRQFDFDRFALASHACRALARVGYLPRGDLRDENDLRRAFETWRPWAVTRFAAHAYVGESILEPPKYYDTNIGGTVKLLETCATFGCRNIVFCIFQLLCDLGHSGARAADGD